MSSKEYVVIGPDYIGEDDYCNVEIFRGTYQECKKYYDKNLPSIHDQFKYIEILKADKIPEGYILYTL